MPRVTSKNSERARQLQLVRQREYWEKMLLDWDNSIPKEYQGHSIEEAIEGQWAGRLETGLKLRRYLANNDDEKFLLATGDTGIGKSTLVCTIARDLIKSKRVRGKYISAPRLLNSFSYRQNEDPVAYYSEVPVLVIDDIMSQSEVMSPIQRTSFWTLIDQRWGSSGLYTLLTTNASIQNTREGIGLAEYFGETGWDRIYHKLTWIQMSGKSFRE